jgi:hypothetical protein
MVTRFVLLLALICVSFPAAAAPHKTGGGCIVREDLCELDEHKSLEPLSVGSYVARLPSVIGWFPAMIPILERAATKRDWYLETRPFNPELCAPVAPVEVEPGLQIAACQNMTEVRISKRFWESSNETQRLRLIVHEIVTSYFLDRETSPELAREAVVQIFRQARFEMKRDRLVQLGFPQGTTSNEIATFMAFIRANQGLICAMDTHSLEEAWRKFVILHFDDILDYRPDFQSIAQEEINSLLRATSTVTNKRACLLIEDLARAEFERL